MREQVEDVVVLQIGLTAYLVVSAILLIMNIVISLANKDYLVDAPPSVIIFSFLPFGWPFYAVSFLRRSNQRAIDEWEELAEEERRERERRRAEFDEIVDRTQASQVQEEVFTFLEDRDAAREIYVELRGDRAIDTIRRRKQTADERLKETTAELKELSDKLRELQRERQEAEVEVRTATDLLKAKEASHKAKADAASEEFDQIFAIEGVSKVRKFGDTLSILIEGKVEYDGWLYDKGDWEMRIELDSAQLWVKERRVGRRDTWSSGVYPDYRLSGGYYCFGDNEHTIIDNLKNGQYLQAIELAATYINSVNDCDRHRIPDCFKRLERKA